MITLKKSNTILVDKVTIQLMSGEICALIGESGSGKTLTGLSLMGLLSSDVFTVRGNISFDNQQLSDESEKKRAKLRLSQMAMIYQEPMSCFNPVLKIKTQCYFAIRQHQRLSKQELNEVIIPFLLRVGLENPSAILEKYPGELSGGQLQRVMIALALVLKPKLLICDEPTTALDVHTQSTIVSLLKELAAEFNMAIIFITHNLGLIENFADYLLIMKDGAIIEEGRAIQVLNKPEKDYTKSLLDSQMSQLLSKSKKIG
ncbi:ABC transporter ATP-binding protein [Vagococcus vulneris]|nr:ABC transporter ATP-binding protein [Vagococcus vulneris]